MRPDNIRSMENLFTAYFRLNGQANGQETLAVPEDGYYPQLLLWESGVYQLEDASYEAGEAHYEYYGKPEDVPSA